MEKVSYLNLVNKGDAGFYYNINTKILVEKYNLENLELIEAGIIKTDEEVAKLIGMVYTRDSADSTRPFRADEVAEFEQRMFECAGLPQDLIGTHEFQQLLTKAYLEYQVADMRGSIARDVLSMQQTREQIFYSQLELAKFEKLLEEFERLLEELKRRENSDVSAI